MERMQRDFDEEVGDKNEAEQARPGWQERSLTRGRLPVIVMCVMGGGLLVGYLTAVFFVFPAKSSSVDLLRVPGVVGLDTARARELIGAADLTYEEEGGLNHRATAGTVIAQEPLAGQMAEPGSSVRVVVSAGKTLSPVPDVVGLKYSQAELALARAGYASESDWVDDDADVGQVVDTRPAPGTPLGLADTVRLFVSAGARRVRVPNLVTLSLSGARETLERLGLRLGDIQQDSASLAAPGTVLGQTPSSGTVVDRATRIAVTVATVPSLELSPDTASGG